jgi:hypothetical protein
MPVDLGVSLEVGLEEGARLLLHLWNAISVVFILQAGTFLFSFFCLLWLCNVDPR